MKTSYILTSCSSGLIPRPIVAFACGSQSIIRTFSPDFWRKPPIFRHEVVFPVPPL